MPQAHTRLKTIYTETTRSELEAKEAREARCTARPGTLPLRDIKVANCVFQWRLEDRELLSSDEHVRELMRSIRATGHPLDPVLVMAVGDAYYLIDGHHRIRAYQSLKWEDSIPVVYFEGSVHEATQEALKRNVKSQLPLTPEAKSEAAWCLVKQEQFTGSQITALTTISARTIATMRGKLRELDGESREVTWAEARRGQWKPDPNTDSRKEQIAKLVQAFRNSGISLKRDPRILADALPAMDERIPDYLILRWADRVGPLMEKYPDEFLSGSLDI